MPLLMAAAPMELVVVHLLAYAFSPWEWLKWALLVLEIYALLWLLGLYASLVTLPHWLEVKGLSLSYGAIVARFAPYKEIQNMSKGIRKARASGMGWSTPPKMTPSIWLRAARPTLLCISKPRAP
jgi:hypothetical protein